LKSNGKIPQAMVEKKNFEPQMPPKEQQAKEYGHQIMDEIKQMKPQPMAKIEDQEKEIVERKFIDLMNDLS